MKTTKPILYLPIEVGNRELLAKIHLASKAINAGYKVVIGQKGLLNRLCSKLPSGVYISGGAFSNYISFFKFLKTKGFKIGVLEEEGLVTYKKKMYIDMRTDQNCFDLIDSYYLWGQHQYNLLLEKHSTNSHKFKITGNPRFDILSPDGRKAFKSELD